VPFKKQSELVGDNRHVSSLFNPVPFPFFLVILAILDVGVGLWHRQHINRLWERLRETSYPPFEAYETLPIDMEAVFVRLPVVCLWLLLQPSSLIVYCFFFRRAGLYPGLAFLALWLLSLLGMLELTFSVLSS
jgi:hypothetical protein